MVDLPLHLTASTAMTIPLRALLSHWQGYERKADWRQGLTYSLLCASVNLLHIIPVNVENCKNF
jgi:hypothetical protein